MEGSEESGLGLGVPQTYILFYGEDLGTAGVPGQGWEPWGCLVTWRPALGGTPGGTLPIK